MVSNYKQKLYFGDPVSCSRGAYYAMNGKFYAISSTLLLDYCYCPGISSKNFRLEDFWLGFTLYRCSNINSTIKFNHIQYYRSLESQIFHKHYSSSHISMKVGLDRAPNMPDGFFLSFLKFIDEL
ncbi:hypothetical protein AYI68_g7343 [Smittium mucronatum]|uniref:Hexosyltransferase n=1 Tax=Smittium mucronatum TaxID=133383 RepID=A0A1R0GNZ3_9FUNG|nr:hypothetical protein AYI68_g7343 [Smittium mucronatum]